MHQKSLETGILGSELSACQVNLYSPEAQFTHGSDLGSFHIDPQSKFSGALGEYIFVRVLYKP